MIVVARLKAKNGKEEEMEKALREMVRKLSHLISFLGLP